jgi:hypothetical protein
MSLFAALGRCASLMGAVRSRSGDEQDRANVNPIVSFASCFKCLIGWGLDAWNLRASLPGTRILDRHRDRMYTSSSIFWTQFL